MLFESEDYNVTFIKIHAQIHVPIYIDNYVNNKLSDHLTAVILFTHSSKYHTLIMCQKL